jgi:hypothetical protein
MLATTRIGQHSLTSDEGGSAGMMTAAQDRGETGTTTAGAPRKATGCEIRSYASPRPGSMPSAARVRASKKRSTAARSSADSDAIASKGRACGRARRLRHLDRDAASIRRMRQSADMAARLQAIGELRRGGGSDAEVRRYHAGRREDPLSLSRDQVSERPHVGVAQAHVLASLLAQVSFEPAPGPHRLQNGHGLFEVVRRKVRVRDELASWIHQPWIHEAAYSLGILRHS